jgi:hypothetical protein
VWAAIVTVLRGRAWVTHRARVHPPRRLGGHGWGCRVELLDRWHAPFTTVIVGESASQAVRLGWRFVRAVYAS